MINLSPYPPRPTVFVSGPYTDLSYKGGPSTTINIGVSRECALWLWENGYYAFSPHLNTQSFELYINVETLVYLDFCIKVLRSGLIDLMVMCGQWRLSQGCFLRKQHSEFHTAVDLHIPVFEWTLGCNELKRLA